LAVASAAPPLLLNNQRNENGTRSPIHMKRRRAYCMLISAHNGVGFSQASFAEIRKKCVRNGLKQWDTGISLWGELTHLENVFQRDPQKYNLRAVSFEKCIRFENLLEHFDCSRIVEVNIDIPPYWGDETHGAIAMNFGMYCNGLRM
jgi:hypothetical protein